MFILLSETDLKQQSAVRDAFRSLGAGIDRAVYGLMGLVFQLFFSIGLYDRINDMFKVDIGIGFIETKQETSVIPVGLNQGCQQAVHGLIGIVSKSNVPFLSGFLKHLQQYIILTGKIAVKRITAYFSF